MSESQLLHNLFLSFKCRCEAWRRQLDEDGRMGDVIIIRHSLCGTMPSVPLAAVCKCAILSVNLERCEGGAGW